MYLPSRTGPRKAGFNADRCFIGESPTQAVWVIPFARACAMLGQNHAFLCGMMKMSSYLKKGWFRVVFCLMWKDVSKMKAS